MDMKTRIYQDYSAMMCDFCLQAEVMVGESECVIEEIHDTNITCYTGRGSRTHIISNQGTDPSKS